MLAEVQTNAGAGDAGRGASPKKAVAEAAEFISGNAKAFIAYGHLYGAVGNITPTSDPDRGARR